MLAILYLDRLLREKGKGIIYDLRFMVPTGVVILLLMLFIAAPGAFFDFISDAERAVYNLRIDNGSASEADVVSFVDGLQEYRMGVLRMDALRSLLFVALGLSVLAPVQRPHPAEGGRYRTAGRVHPGGWLDRG
ncbi:MAG: hypothetical protein IPL52_11665 [Flavobacteriales bacterium]|nr:hypothetical protein [Flavobacteriales bacterium]